MTAECCGDLRKMFERGFFYGYNAYGHPDQEVAMRLINKDVLPMTAAEIEKEKNIESSDVTIKYCPFCGHKFP